MNMRFNRKYDLPKGSLLLLMLSLNMKLNTLSRCALTTLLTAFTAFTTANIAQAGDRRFTYVYETTTSAKGSFELETWATWKTNNGFDQFEFRHEFEYAVTDRLQLGLYLPVWTADEEGRSRFKNVALEAIYSLSNPNTDFLGSALYGEVKVGERLFVLEGKLLLQKNFGPLMIAWNGIIEAEWEGPGLNEKTGVLGQSLGVSWQFSPSFSVGAEAVHEVEFADWSEAGEHVVYAGPNVSFRGKKWFATLTSLFQVTDIEEEADVQTRLIFGIHF
jgi:hypothetical protein